MNRLTATLAVVSALALAGCATTAGPAPSTPPTVTASAAALGEASFSVDLDGLPDAIAADLNALSFSSSITPGQVSSAALWTCLSDYQPGSAITLLRSTRVPNLLLAGPAARLLTLASRNPPCSSPPTARQQQAYTKAVYAFLNGRSIPAFPTPPSLTPTETRICTVLESDGFETAADVAAELVHVLSRERITVPEALTTGVQVAGKSCSTVLPVAKRWLREYTESPS